MPAYTRIFFLPSSRKLLHAYFNKKVGKPIRIKLKDLNFIAVCDMIFIYRGHSMDDKGYYLQFSFDVLIVKIFNKNISSNHSTA